MLITLLRSTDLGGVQRPGYVVGVVAAAARMAPASDDPPCLGLKMLSRVWVYGVSVRLGKKSARREP